MRLFRSNNQLSDILNEAQKSKWAIPHFNISLGEQFRSIVTVATDLNSPIIIGCSEGEIDFLGYDYVVTLRDYWRSQTKIPLFINADHHHSLERAKQAIDAGFDSVNIDCSLEPEHVNMAETRAVVIYAKEHGNCNIEGEIGALPTQSSEVIKKKITIDPNTLTTPEEALRFFEATDIDRLTPAVGTLHGILSTGKNPDVDFNRLEAITNVLPIPLTLHGGSGLTEADFKKAAALVSNIHINTELRLAFSSGIKKEIKKTTTPYKYLSVALKEFESVVAEKIALFGSANRG